MSNFKQRTIFSFLSVAATLLLLYFSTKPYLKFLFPIALTSILCFGQWEFYQLAKKVGFSPNEKTGLLLSISYLLATTLQCLFFPKAMLIFIVFYVFAILLFYLQMQITNELIANISITAFGFIYITLPLSFFLWIIFCFQSDFNQDARAWILYLLFTTKLTDTGAYFFGKLIGSHKMSPVISPKKTWEGAVGGILIGVITSISFCLISKEYFPSAFHISMFEAVILGFALSLLAQFGDLAESLLKRSASVKDSSTLPGFGGILDILDSLVFTTPILYIYLKLNN